MGYKWKPSAAQRRAFAEKMQDAQEREAYEERKRIKKEKRKATSEFDYESAGGNYVPTKFQCDFCVTNMHLFKTSKEMNAANMVIGGFTCNEKVHHDYIHIVNEKIRSKKE